MTRKLSIALSLLVTISPALGAGLNAPPTGGVVKPEKSLPGKPDKTALTIEQCVGLGGKVIVASCAGGYMCRRADQNGVIHSACIDGK